ncbi:MAG: DUF1295 domain-containing protein [Mycobacteriaceae bacterium]
MTDFSWTEFGQLALLSLIAVAALITLTAVIGFHIKRHNVIDVAWGLGFVLVSWVSAIAGTGDIEHRILFAVIVSIWGLRLAFHMAKRSLGKGEDPRYAELLSGNTGNLTLFTIRKVYAIQAISLWFVSLPVQVGAVSHGSFGVAAYLGMLLWLVGITFEAVGDAQMERFKADPHRGAIMDRGLWSWTRHPNYFGDSCLWWGIFLIAADSWPGVLTIASPIAMTYFLVFATGARLLERSMSLREGYLEYQKRTSFFFPLPPKRYDH